MFVYCRGRGGGCLDSMDGGAREEQHDVGKDFSCMFGFHVSYPTVSCTMAASDEPVRVTSERASECGRVVSRFLVNTPPINTHLTPSSKQLHSKSCSLVETASQ